MAHFAQDHVYAANEEELATDLVPVDEGFITKDDDSPSLDDSSASDLDIGASVDVDDALTAGDDGDAPIDVGMIDDALRIGADFGLDDGHEGVATDDADGMEGVPESPDDEGAEGFQDAGEGGIDEDDLPALDADDGPDHADTWGEIRLPEAPNVEISTWPVAAAPWLVREDLGVEVPCTAVAMGRDGAVLAGTEAGVLWLEEGARRTRRGGPTWGAIRSLCALGDGLIAVAGHRIVGTKDAQGEGWTAGSLAADADTTLTAAPNHVWAQVGDAVYRFSADTVPAAVRVRDSVLAACASGASLVMLVTSGNEAFLERVRGDDEAVASQRLDGEMAIAVAEDVRFAATADGQVVGLFAPALGLAVSRDFGLTFEHFDMRGLRALTFAGDGDDAALLAVVADRAETWLLEVGVGGAPRRVSKLASSEGTFALSWDHRREVVWVASGAGLVALERPRRH